MTPSLDITGFVCPMTFVRVKMRLEAIAPGGRLLVVLKDQALKNVISSLKTDGHTVVGVSRQDENFVIEIEKKA